MLSLSLARDSEADAPKSTSRTHFEFIKGERKNFLKNC